MDTGVNSNYQMAFGMRELLKSPEIIQRKAKHAYQHISPITFDRMIWQKVEQMGAENPKLSSKLRFLTQKLYDFREKLLASRNPEKFLIEQFKNGKIANGGEEIALATIIGKMNGQENIYNGYIDGLDHGVSFITNKIIKNGSAQKFKNKEAIIIDPQLGITDYAGNYFAKLKEIMGIPKKGKLTITPFNNHKINAAQIEDLRSNYPELVINGYKQVKM